MVEKDLVGLKELCRQCGKLGSHFCEPAETVSVKKSEYAELKQDAQKWRALAEKYDCKVLVLPLDEFDKLMDKARRLDEIEVRARKEIADWNKPANNAFYRQEITERLCRVMGWPEPKG